MIIPGSTFDVEVTVNTVSALVWPAAEAVSCGNSMVLVKKPCSTCTAVSDGSIEVMPKRGAVPFGMSRVIIEAKLFFARSWVRVPVLKIPVDILSFL